MAPLPWSWSWSMRWARPPNRSHRYPATGRSTAAERGAYLIYTSGSTGKPKSVVVDHPAIVNRLEMDAGPVRPAARRTVLHKTPIGFDVSVWELFGVDLWRHHRHGGARSTPGVAIAETLARQRITTAHFVPSLLRAFLAETSDALPDLRRILCSGEALTAPLRDGVAARFLHVRLHNLYGPTEAAVDVTEIDVTDLDGPVMPIGAIVEHRPARARPDARRTADRVWGELYLSGRQLARGYAGPRSDRRPLRRPVPSARAASECTGPAISPAGPTTECSNTPDAATAN